MLVNRAVSKSNKMRSSKKMKHKIKNQIGVLILQ
jgi:hypothetical protein